MEKQMEATVGTRVLTHRDSEPKPIDETLTSSKSQPSSMQDLSPGPKPEISFGS